MKYSKRQTSFKDCVMGFSMISPEGLPSNRSLPTTGMELERGRIRQKNIGLNWSSP
jgi:hypothetical protein